MGQFVGQEMGKLTGKAVESIARDGKPGRTGDGDGLYFQVSRAGVLSWVFRYTRDGRSREMGLGPYPVVTLAKARLLAGDQRKVLAAGNDPMAARDAERAAKREAEREQMARRVTFADVAHDYMQAHGADWSEKWRRGWRRKLELYAFPVLGNMPAGDIETAHVLKSLQPIWGDKTRTADEVRGQIESILDAAKARGFAKWRQSRPLAWSPGQPAF